jgi:hypothetical protein
VTYLLQEQYKSQPKCIHIGQFEQRYKYVLLYIHIKTTNTVVNNFLPTLRLRDMRFLFSMSRVFTFTSMILFFVVIALTTILPVVNAYLHVSTIRQQHRYIEEAAEEEDVVVNDDEKNDDDLFSWTTYSDYAQQTYYSYSNNNGNSFWNNFTQTVSESDPNIDAAKDVSVDTVVASLYFNALAFISLMIFYELLRHFLPAVYSSKKRLDVIHHSRISSSMNGRNSNDTTNRSKSSKGINENDTTNENDEDEINLPDERPLDWIRPVLGVPWQKVREMVGLDGYFFLRYIRMNVRITAISTFWIFLILVPVYFYGGNEASNLTSGWYRISAANLSAQSKLMWIPCIVLYFFTGFIFFVIQQEYEHYFNIRQDFLAKGSTHVHPQHHYSVLVENIPDIYQSDVALAKYMESLFPNSVHSAVVVLNVPDLNEASNKCMRTCRRLEKSIAYWHATGQRPTHIVGRARMRLLGIIDMAPLNCPTTSLPRCNDDSDSEDEDDQRHTSSRSSTYTPMTDEAVTTISTKAMMDGTNTPQHTTTPIQSQPLQFEPRPPRGTRVDSISYYTQELAAHSRTLFRMQQKKIKIANEGAQQLHDEHLRISALINAANGTKDSSSILQNPFWFDQILYEATQVADQILDDSEFDNALITPPTYDEIYDPKKTTTVKQIPSVVTDVSSTSNPMDYGSISPTNSTNTNRRVQLMRQPDNVSNRDDATSSPRLYYAEGRDNSDYLHEYTSYQQQQQQYQSNQSAPFTTDQYSTWIRRWLGRLGLDFVVFVIRYISKQWDISCNGTLTGNRKSSTMSNPNIMSRTGFVTFLDLASTTTAVSAPLNSNRSQINGGPFDASLAPEPRVRMLSLIFTLHLLTMTLIQSLLSIRIDSLGNYLGQRTRVQESYAPT